MDTLTVLERIDMIVSAILAVVMAANAGLLVWMILYERRKRK